MRNVSFGTHDAKASAVVLGLWRTKTLDADAVGALLDAAEAAEINMLDTADIYGDGRCEEILGDALAARPGMRDRLLIQTKVGIRRHPRAATSYYDFSYEHIVGGVEASLARLRTDHIDSLLLHRPDVLMEPEEVARAFETLRLTGKVLDFGVSNLTAAATARIQSCLGFPLVATQMQLSCAYSPAIDSILNVNTKGELGAMRDDGIFAHAAEHDMAIQAWSVMQAGDGRGSFMGNPDFAELNGVLERIGGERGVSASAVAVAWVLRYPAKMQAIIGTTRPERVAESARAADIRLSREEWYEIYAAAGNKIP